MVAKGRQRLADVAGEKNGRAKITVEGVRRAKALLKSEPVTAVARQLGVSPGLIRHIKFGRTWADVAA